MNVRFFVVASLAAIALGACATPTRDGPFDPNACYTREFNVYFEGQTVDLSDSAREVIDTMGSAVRGCYIDSVRVIGSADARGGSVTNDEISERRAQVITDYLSERVGWPRSRTEMLATGERGAVTDEGFNVPMRRRAHIVVVATPPR